MYNLEKKEHQLFSDFIIEWKKFANSIQVPNKEKKHVLLLALISSCRNDFSYFQDFPYEDMIA